MLPARSEEQQLDGESQRWLCSVLCLLGAHVALRAAVPSRGLQARGPPLPLLLGRADLTGLQLWASWP